MPDDTRDSTETEQIDLAHGSRGGSPPAAESATSEIAVPVLIPPTPAPATPIRGDAAPVEGSPPGQDPRRRRVLWAALATVAAAGIALAFLAGTGLRDQPTDPAPAAGPVPTTAVVTPSPAPVVEEQIAVGPADLGLRAWDRLVGGECLEPYASPWELEFTVADCAAPHAAQLTHRGAFAEPAGAAYPGEAGITSQLNLLCSGAEALDLGAAGQYPDLQTQASYPAGQAQWDAGDRAYSCFVSRSSGQPLTGSLAPASLQ